MNTFLSEALVLHRMPYRESSYILKLYTEQSGRKDFILSGVRKKNSKISAGAIHPGSYVEIEGYHKGGDGLGRLHRLKPAFIYRRIPFDIFRGSISIFSAELVLRLVTESESHPALYRFLRDYFLQLDQTDQPIRNMHLHLCAELSGYLGIRPQAEAQGSYYDLLEGSIAALHPGHIHVLSEPAAQHFCETLNWTLASQPGVYTRAERKIILQAWIDYFRIHAASFSGIKSLSVLHEIMDQLGSGTED